MASRRAVTIALGSSRRVNTGGTRRVRPRSARFEPVAFVKDVTTPVPRVLLSATLAGPAPSGGADTSRLCQGCSRPPRHHPDQAALSFTALLRQDGGEGHSPPLEQTAPHGVGRHTATRCIPPRRTRRRHGQRTAPARRAGGHGRPGRPGRDQGRMANVAPTPSDPGHTTFPLTVVESPGMLGNWDSANLATGGVCEQ